MKKLAPRIVVAALLGAVAFILVQKLTGSTLHIAQFMGRRITDQGGYDASLAPVIGWGVHLGVSITYAALYALLANFIVPGTGGAKIAATLVLALVLGWVTTLLTAPAIAVTIGVLSGSGVPASLPPLNTAIGVPLLNHVLFFLIAWLVTVVTVDRRAG